jgi:hypothetical protein
MATKTTRKRPAANKAAAAPAQEIVWAELLNQALTMPGKLGNTFNRFYEYSFLNVIWLMVQGVQEPCGPYGLWQKLGRQVSKGSKAKTVLHPVFAIKRDKETGKPVLDSNGKQQRFVIGFRPKSTVFVYSQTEGEELSIPELPEWSLEMALKALDIKQVPFKETNGNVGGYSIERKIAINPVSNCPLHTSFHELAHVVLGHTSKDELKDYQEHRGMKEFEAEATAYLLMNELEVTEKGFDLAESRAYIQNWLAGAEVPDKNIRRVFTATNTILKAGRPVRVTEES